MKAIPNLFILGAPKSGTTSLCEYLSEHQNVLFSDPKEPKYFHTDFSDAHRYCLSEKEYLSCFGEAEEYHKYVAEGTVWYLYSESAVPAILKFNPDSRFIVLLRNPVDLAHSLHSQLLYGGDEDIEDFELAWNLQDKRKNCRSLPKACRDAKALIYGEIASLGWQVDRLLKLVDPVKVKFIRFDDLCSDPRTIYLQVLEFLHLPDDGREGFNRTNQNRSIKSKKVSTVLFFVKRIKSALGVKRSFGVWGKLQPLIAETKPRVAISEELRAVMEEYFEKDTELLNRLLDDLKRDSDSDEMLND
jgi:hypothetical protein